MFDGPLVVQALKQAGVTHVVWLPDSELGRWEPALCHDKELRLVRVAREGEAIAVAAGLLIGGKQPVVVIQCTGLFEAGDALRNAVHDLKLPLFLIVGLRGYYAHRQGTGFDTCPIFAEPIMKTWRITYRVLDESSKLQELIDAYQKSRDRSEAGAVLMAE
jgi:sulfopyruvate decarboxylase subunit alpha